MSPARRIAVVTPDTVTASMAGPAIRAWHMASELSKEHEVVLATTSHADHEPDTFSLRAVDDDGLRSLADWCDIMVVQGWVLARRPWLVRSGVIMVVDAYDPLHLEQLEQTRDRPPRERRESVWHATAVLNEQLCRADLVLCASERQRLFWLGALGALGRLNPATYDDDATLHGLLRVVPFGLSDDPPVQRRHAIRGVIPGVGVDDRIVLWGGGIYNWLDPLTPIRAIGVLRDRLPAVRLVFMGLRHPNPASPEMRLAVEARRLADSLQLTGSHVFFNEGWVPYEERADHLLDADVGVTCHQLHLETELSFRTRVLDYLWASLPVVTTDGDEFARLVADRSLGGIVPAGDVDALASSLERLLTDAEVAAECRTRVQQAAARFRWSHVLKPLVDFCRAPSRSADFSVVPQRRIVASGPPLHVPAVSGPRGALDRARGHVREGGYPLLARRAVQALGRRLRVIRGPAAAPPPPPSE